MLEGALEYRDISRTDAGQLAMCEFAQFHIQHEMESLLLSSLKTKTMVAAIATHIAGEESTNDVPPGMNPLSSTLLMYNKQTMSVVLEGSVN
jgi:hypothetical protein